MKTINLKDHRHFIPVNDINTNHEKGCRLSVSNNLVHRSNYSDQNLREVLQQLSSQGMDRLNEQLSHSEATEQKLIEKITDAFEAWRSQAQETRILDMALEIANAQKPKHSGNTWENDDLGSIHTQKISNSVFSLEISCEARESYSNSNPIPCTKWVVSWRLRYNAVRWYPRSTIAGTDKKFSDFVKAEQYIDAVKAQYADYFMEENPPVPVKAADCFSINGVLLAGYYLEEEHDALPEAC